MTIRFRCECGRVLMASEEQAGQEGQCPACGQVLRIPQGDDAAAMEKPEESAPAEEFDQKAEAGAVPPETEKEEGFESDFEKESAGAPGRREWRRSSRFAVLASIIAVVVVAIVVFLIVRGGREPQEEVVVIQKMEPATETGDQKATSSVGAMLEDEETEEIFPSSEIQPIVPYAAEEEPIEEILTEPVTEEEVLPEEVPETVPVEESEQPVVASTITETPPAGETPPVEETAPAERKPSAAKMPPPGTFAINLASFKEKSGAESYLQELKAQGIDAFDWEVDLPEKGRWYRVSVGGFDTREEAEDFSDQLKQQGISDTFITQIPGAS